MVYRSFHYEKNDQCPDDECNTLTAYVRIEGKWTRIGYYGSICNQFSPLDLKQEEEDWKLKQRVIMITYLVRKSRKMSSEDFEKELKRIDEFR